MKSKLLEGTSQGHLSVVIAFLNEPNIPLHIFLGKKWELHNGGLAHAHQVQQSQFTCGIYLHLVQIMDEINYKFYLLDDFITQIGFIQIIEGKQRWETTWCSSVSFTKLLCIYPKWQSSIGRRCRKNGNLSQEDLAKFGYKLDMKYKSSTNFLDLWLHIKKQKCRNLMNFNHFFPPCVWQLKSSKTNSFWKF